MAASAQRPWLRFRLRTLLLALTATSVLTGWLGWNARYVRERRALLVGKQWETLRGGKLPTPSISWIRRMMGDEATQFLLFEYEPSPEQFDRATRLFPEATIMPQFRPADRRIHYSAVYRMLQEPLFARRRK